MLNKLIQYFIENRWQVVYFTGKTDEYCNIKYKLITDGIKVKTKVINQNSGARNMVENGMSNIGYEIYVPWKESERANKVIHSIHI